MTPVHQQIKLNPKLNPIKTKDDSFTLHNADYDETLHSVSGAAEEAVRKYVEPAAIAAKAKSGSISILDIGFGIGFNSAAAIDSALLSNPECKIHIIGLEKDRDTLSAISDLTIPFKCSELIKTAVNAANNTAKESSVDGQVSIHLIVGDATKTIKSLVKIRETFDVIFLDAFSPPKNPELWTVEFMSDIAQLCTKTSVLATYSCARVTRDNLETAGFRVEDGPRVGRRGPSTVAYRVIQ